MNSSEPHAGSGGLPPRAIKDRKVAPISLILTVLNAEADLADLLISIARQSVLPAELVIADLGSADGTRKVISAWRAPVEMLVMVMECPGASTSEARNLAIESASCGHIAVTHGASRLHRDWLANLWSAMLEGSEAVAGFVQPVGASLMERVIGRAGLLSVDENGPSPLLPPSTSVAFTRTIWDTVGGYPEWLHFGQDEAFDRAVRETGVTFRFVPSARSSWSPRQTLMEYFQDGFRISKAESRAGINSVLPLRLLAAYVGGATAVVIFPRSIPVRAAAGGLLAGRSAAFLTRVWRTRDGNPDRLVPRLLATILVVLVGDAAKLCGFPAGRAIALWEDQALGRSLG